MTSGAKNGLRPEVLFILGFLAAPVLGALLLLVPGFHQGPLSFLDALFTCVSAVCVTGLTVVDTGTVFTLPGQLVILALIQVGGLGIVTFFLVLTGTAISFQSQQFLEGVFTAGSSNFYRLFRGVFILTIGLELLGAIGLWWLWHEELGPKAAYYAIFHSISAFCNAGFSLFPDSLMSQSLPVSIIIAGLVMLGGLGFIVLLDLLEKAVGGRRKKLRVHTKLVVSTSVILWSGAALLFWLVERHNTIEGIGVGGQLMHAFFLSVTPRTAGFNTLDTAALAPLTLFVIMALMFIGTGPGGTGGGVKVTTFAMSILSVFNRLRGYSSTVVFQKEIPNEFLLRTLTVMTLAVITLFLGILALVRIELSSTGMLGSGHFIKLLFEAISAFATVGLSMGLTPVLAPGSKVVLIVLMFLGRIGPLTLAVALARKSIQRHVHYTQENLMIG